MPGMRRPSLNRFPLLVVAGLLVLGVAVPMSEGELGFGSNAGASAAPTTSAGSSGGLGVVGAPTLIPTGTAAPTAAPTDAPAASPAAARGEGRPGASRAKRASDR